MTRAVFVTFGADEYMKQDQRYHSLFPLFIRGLVKSKDYFDKLYLIDSDWRLTGSEYGAIANFFNENQVVIEQYTSYRTHWENLNYAKEIHEDTILFLDNDTLVYEPKIIDRLFRELEEKPGATGVLDSSGKFYLGEEILEANPNRGRRFRLAPYFSLVSKSWLVETDQNFYPRRFNEGFRIPGFHFQAKEGDWTDPMGWITIQLLAVGCPISELHDDRRSLYIQDDNSMMAEVFSDCSVEQSTGFYHIRNFFGGFNLINARLNRPDDYSKLRQLITRKEALRLLAWFVIACPEAVEHAFMVANDYGISRNLWERYLVQYPRYYDWLESYA